MKAAGRERDNEGGERERAERDRGRKERKKKNEASHKRDKEGDN